MYEFTQLCNLGAKYGIARGIINVDDIPVVDWEHYINLFGYAGIGNFIERNGMALNKQLLAELMFETDWKQYLLHDHYEQEDEAVKAIHFITG